MSNYIICPCCGKEYAPVEIYIPKRFFGEPGEIIRDESGKIEFCTGDDMDLTEEFECDNCGKQMTITATVTFTVNSDDFEEEYTTFVNKPKKIELEEPTLF